MSRSDLERFYGDMRETPALLDEVRELLHDPGAVIRWANGKGYNLDPKDAEELCESHQELTDDDLDKVAGGDTAWPPPTDPTGGG